MTRTAIAATSHRNDEYLAFQSPLHPTESPLELRRSPTIGTRCMFTQQFRLFRDNTSRFSCLLALLSVFVLLFGCEAEEGPVEGDPALTRSNLCDPPCSGVNRGCFFDEDTTCPSPPCVGCYEVTCPPENPIQACASGAVCQDGVCTFPNVCTPNCGPNTHCVAGNCIPNYTNSNVCDPLENCRNQCGPNTGCIAACEQDRSSTCRSCIASMNSCEARDSCIASATGCCSDEYCACFPNSSGCSGNPCATCWNDCQSSSDVFACFNQCAGASPACATCLQPFNARPDCKVSNPSQECQDLFYGCIE